jgi:predicted NBD/HSP70 family sugar kinase
MIGDPRVQGRRVLLTAIRSAGRIARIDLAKQTGISQATVTTITAELIKDGLIEEVARSSSEGQDMRRGRPRVDLKVRGAAITVAGIKLTNRSISGMFMDFEGTDLGDFEVELGRSVYEPDALSDVIADALKTGADMCSLKLDDILAVGIGMAGIVDADRGFVHWSPSLAERNVPLMEKIAIRLDKHIFVDNDVNLVAMAERDFGHGRSVSDFIVVTVESGVGMGIVLDGELYRGTRGCGAEFGHTKVQLDGALCRCGQRGCLEAYVGDYAILREAAVGLADTETSEQSVEAVLQSARDGDMLAQSIVNRAGRMFAMGLANLVNIFDPQLIILAGERMQLDHLYAEEVIDSIRHSIVQIDMAPPQIVIHKWGNQMWAKGAAAYALSRMAEIALEELGKNVA